MLHNPLATSISVVLCTLLLCGCERPTPPDPPMQLTEAASIRLGLVAAGGGSREQVVDAAPVGVGWGTLKGRFVLATGASPRPPQPLTVNKDQEICAPGNGPVLDEVFLFDSASRGIQNVVVYARDANRVHDEALPNTEEVIFDQEDCIFLSHVFPMRVGQTLQIKNSDPVGHNTNIAAQRGISFNQTIPADQSISFKPTAEEVMPIGVNCSIHPWMQAYLLPRGNGYFAVTAADGSFEIANLPAGEEVEFQVWHEIGAGAGGAVAAGEAESVEVNNRGRFTLKLDENEVRTLEIVLPGSAFKG